MDEVIVPYGATEIRSKAFAGSSIQSIYIPDTVEFIAEDAFEGADDVTIYAPSESYAEEYAVGRDYLWQNSGNFYQYDEFLETKDRYENLESGSWEDVSLQAAEITLVDESMAEGDEELLASLRAYNEGQQELQMLLQDYQGALSEMTGEMETFAELYEETSLEYTDTGISYEYAGFSYYVNTSALEAFGPDAEIVSVSSSEDGETLLIELLSNGVTYYLEGDMTGLNISSMQMTVRSASMAEQVLIEFDAPSITARGSDSEGNEVLIQSIIEQVTHYSTIIKVLNKSVEKAREKLPQVIFNANEQLAHVNVELQHPEVLKKLNLYNTYLRDSKMYAALLKAAEAATPLLERAHKFLGRLDPIATLASIREDFSKWKELGRIYEHGHPTDAEKLNGPKLALATQMISDCRAARAAYMCNIINSSLSLVDKTCTAVSAILIASGFLTGGAGPALGALAKVASSLGVKTTRTWLMNLAAGFVMGTSASVKYKSVLAADKQLHGGVKGVVTDALTGKPVRYVTVEVDGMTVNTNSKGEYQVNLPEGQYTLGFVKRGYGVELKDVTVKELGTYVECNVILHPNGSLAGNVVDAETNLPLAGVTVRYDYHETNTDIEGKYILSAEPGSEQLTFTAEGYETWSVTAECESGMTKIYDAALQKKQENTPTPTPAATSTPTPTPTVTTTPAVTPAPTPTATPEPTVSPSVTYTPQENFYWYTFWHDDGTYRARLWTYLGNDSVVVIPKVIETTVDATLVGDDGVHSCLVTYIEYGAFEECDSVTSVIIPDGVIEISGSAFDSCSNLTTVIMPNSVTDMYHNVFMGCSSLKNIILSNQLTEIDDGVFQGCSDLEEINIPSSVTSIGQEAFEGCSSLKSITIPASVTYISYYRTFDNSGLTTAYVSTQYAADYFAENYPDVQVIWN